MTGISYLAVGRDRWRLLQRALCAMRRRAYAQGTDLPYAGLMTGISYLAVG